MANPPQLKGTAAKNAAGDSGRTLVLIKPDGVQRRLIGEIIRRYEAAGLRIVGLKLVRATDAVLAQHYPADEGYLISLGKKSEAAGDNVQDYKAQGRMVISGLRTFLKEGPIVAMVVAGPDAIKQVRAITGYTDPAAAAKGTIRGDFPADSILTANKEKRAVRNLVHASGNPEEAAKEIALWFKPGELVA